MKASKIIPFFILCVMFAFFVHPQTVEASGTIVQGISSSGKVEANYDENGWDKVKKDNCFYTDEDLNFMLCAGSDVFVKSVTLYIDGVEQLTMYPNETFMRFCNSIAREKIVVKPGEHTMQMKVEYALYKETNTSTIAELEKVKFYVYEAPSVKGPDKQTVAEGDTAKFIVSGNGGAGERRYQWYYATSTSGKGTAIEDSTFSTHTVPKVTGNKNGRYYYCEVKDVCKHCGKVKRTLTSSRARLNVYYNIGYNLNGGNSTIQGQSKEHGKALTLRTAEPTRTGYIFQGWGTSKDASIAAYQPGDKYTNNKSIILYAVWKLKEYKVTYDANGGNGAPSSQTKYHGKTLTLRTKVPTRKGYKFAGWATTNDATQINYKSGGKYSANKNLKLYAVWKKPQTITASSKTVAYNKKTFILNAKSSGNGKLTYTSGNKNVAIVSSKGVVTVKGYGKTTITIKAPAKGNYLAASKKITIKVVPKKVTISSCKSPEKKELVVKWNKDTTVTGYQIHASLDKTFSKNTIERTTGNNKTSTKVPLLKSGKTYYVRVRSYKTVNGVKYYSAWSETKSVKIK